MTNGTLVPQMIVGISRKKSPLLAHLVYARIGEDTCHPTYVDVHEMSTVIYKSLYYYGVPTFSVVVVNRILIWYVCPINSTSALGKPSFLNPSITSIKAAPDGTVT